MTRGRDAGDAPPEPPDEFLHDLADLASDGVPEPLFEPMDEDLREANPQDQAEAMRRWFLERFCDPAYETPYETAEGGYIWIAGGPYYADEELHARFSGVVDDSVINEVMEDLSADGLYQWAPVRRGDDDYFDHRFDLDVDQPDDPLSALKARLAQALSALELRGDPDAMAQVPRMVFGAAISALEAFLWETVAFWAKSDREVLKRIVSNVPELRDQPIKLGEIFDRHDAIEARVMVYLRNLVWHRWDKVALMLKYGLTIKPPSFRPFEEALLKRHHIVHRSGRDMDGNIVSVAVEDATALAASVEEFATAIHAAIDEQR